MKKIILLLLFVLLLWCGYENNIWWINNIDENTIEITKVNTWRVTEKNWYFLVNPTTYWFKYGNYFTLYGQINNPTIDFSGQQLATISGNYATFYNITMKYPDNAKAWSYYDKELHGYAVIPFDGRWSGKNLSISTNYFISDRYGVGEEQLMSISYNPWIEEAQQNKYCEDKNDAEGPWAWVADDYFSQNIYQKDKINIYRTYRGYGEVYIWQKTTRHSLCFVFNNGLYVIELYNYTKDETNTIFDSLEFIK